MDDFSILALPLITSYPTGISVTTVCGNQFGIELAYLRFLGHTSFYKRFKKDLSKISKPLSNMLNKDVMFKFDEECLLAFHTVKES